MRPSGSGDQILRARLAATSLSSQPENLLDFQLPPGTSVLCIAAVCGKFTPQPLPSLHRCERSQCVLSWKKVGHAATIDAPEARVSGFELRQQSAGELLVRKVGVASRLRPSASLPCAVGTPTDPSSDVPQFSLRATGLASLFTGVQLGPLLIQVCVLVAGRGQACHSHRTQNKC